MLHMAVILRHLCLSTATPGSTSHIASQKEKCEELSSPKATLHGVFIYSLRTSVYLRERERAGGAHVASEQQISPNSARALSFSP